MKTDNQNICSRRNLAGQILRIVLLVFGVATTQIILQAGSTEPTIESVTPESGPEGTVVTIAGVNFGPLVGSVQGTSGVNFNGVWSTPSRWSATEITVAVPPGAATGSVVVTVSGQPSAGVGFTVAGTGGSGPAIGTVSPTLGLEGTLVTIRGANFGPEAETGGVSFNGVWAPASSWSEEEIRVAVPADAGTGPVVVAANGQASNGVGFIVLEPGLGEPAIDFLSADSGPEGMVVTIEGANFGPSIGAYEGRSGVSFNGVWGQPTYWSETVIQVPVPTGAPSGLVTMAVDGEASNGMAFAIERPAPVIEAVDSSFGPEGTTVEITGRNFGPAMEAVQGRSGVSFDGVWGVPIYWSDRQIQVAPPRGIMGGLIVVTSVEQESNGIPFAVMGARTEARVAVASSRDESGGPTISKLKPDSGPVGTSVKLKGSGFGASQGTSTVAFNGKAASPSLWSDRKIRVPVPAGAGAGPVVVTVDGKASNGVQFNVAGTVGSNPDIKKLKPGSGSAGTWVKVKGSDFGAMQGTGAVTFNGTVAVDYRRWSDRKIRVKVPAGAATGPVVVTVDGQASSGVEFTVTATPASD